MVKYELVFILDCRLSDGEKADISRQVSDVVTRAGGNVLNLAVWMERQRFSFPMGKAWEGTYYLMDMEITGPEVARIRRDLQLNERILRFLIVRGGAPLSEIAKIAREPARAF
jgi:small subunit ribosomal protein S6